MKTIKKIVDVPQNDPCLNCITCIRLKLMEMGFIKNEYIEIEDKKLGLYLVRVISEENSQGTVIALREDEFKRLCLI